MLDEQSSFVYLSNSINWIFAGITNPKFTEIYAKAIEQVEKLSWFFNLAFTKVTIVFVAIPSFIISFVLYFGTDSESYAFRLPFPVWWALKISFFFLK